MGRQHPEHYEGAVPRMQAPETTSGQLELAAPQLSAAAKRIVPWLCGTALFMELLDATS
jgi:hypothetical protein